MTEGVTTSSIETKLQTSPSISEEEKERRKRKLLLEWQELESSKVAKTILDAFIERETRSIGRRLEAQSESYSPKCVSCGGVGRHLKIDCGGVNWIRVVQAS
jgi:hypothetical protein